MSKNHFFTVWEGHETGVFSSWKECQQQINGYANAKYKGFATQKEAQEALHSPYWDFVGQNKKEKQPNTELIKKVGMPNFDSLSVDAACSGNPGKMEYRGVYTKTGEEVFHFGPVVEGTNNIGEFLAIIHGLALLKQKNINKPIYTDSKIALSWLKAKKARTNLKQNEKNKSLFNLIERAENWLKNNTFTTPILKWETEAWGEIPADFGRK